ncbi:uncharacterized protein BP01DRAFT_350314 [Aspergillus saccharolyticus JOP 1030-1]|uniref:Non-homologous end-joining factor 1 n=1 Tax=Aspergillus saccharolyticus JOP 1030-1 TaxID=1450539 RepID=A0A318Z1J1_9EURO|nr:XLF-domain-containing protein [Aspergillus saccharolyticus JOP 1030-1]PYH40886.1 XLF-domain-containing protein [Aspergillus saccharolyticus JOP 1030-1]
MPSKWQRLHVSRSDTVPTLLYKYSFTSDDYALYITDLTYMWSEHLDYKSILRRADDDNTTIDPSEDREQFNVLLQKVGEALQHDSGQNSAVLGRGSEDTHLHLSTTTKLPAPLKPLRWNFYLTRAALSATTEHLLIPLMKAEAVWQSRERLLIDQLKKKDWVLGKLFDKLETLGIDIGTIFPGVSAHRSGQKETVLSHTAKYIKGVEPFDQDSWASETNAHFPELGSAASLATEAAGARVSDADKPQSLSVPPSGWWEQLSAAVVDSVESSDIEPRKQPVDRRQFNDSLETDTDSGMEDDDDDDEFERQETPPHLKRTTAQASPSSRSPERDTAQRETRSPSPGRPSAQKPSTRNGLGIIGGRPKPQPKGKTPSPPPAPAVDFHRNKPNLSATPPPKATDYDATASETDGDDDLSPPPPPRPKALASSKRGFGVIGGKKKDQDQPPPTSSTQQFSRPPSDQSSKSLDTQPLPKRTGQLGVIGGIKRSTKPPVKSQSSPDAAPDAKSGKYDDLSGGDTAQLEPSRPIRSGSHEQKPVLAPSTEQTKESEEQRADRKRDELKRQLEAKAKAPAKKKRKF